jgi:hypothetical protein
MSPRSFRELRIALISWSLFSGAAIFAQADPAWAGPPSGLEDIAPEPGASLQESRRTQTKSGRDRLTPSEQAARDLALTYLAHWSAPNRVTLASASSFYGPTVTFHGRTRTLGSVLAEKRRVAERWPDRTYHYRPETTQVSCEPGGARCTVWSIFDFSATNSREGRHSLGLGEHELIVNFSSGRPVIASETSRVVYRGRGNMSWLLEEGL